MKTPWIILFFGLALLLLLVTGQENNGTNCPTACYYVVSPVCGTDGETYTNKCFMNRAICNNPGVQWASDGACNSTSTTESTTDSSSDSSTDSSTDSTTDLSTDPTKDTTTDSSMNSTTVPTRG